MGRAFILNEKVKTACGVAGASRSEADEASVAEKTMKHLRTQGRSATAWIAATVLAMTWASETQSFPDHARHLADARHATAARNYDSDGTARHGDFGLLPPGWSGNDKSVQVAQATTNDKGQSPEQEPHWAEAMSCELTNARRDIELLQHLEQERDRAEWLEEALGAARRDVDTQAALAAKAGEDVLRRTQAAEAAAAEPRQSMQKERERADAQVHGLSMTRSAIYAYEAQVRKAGDEAAELRQAAANGALALSKSAQDERQRSARLEEELAGARRDVEIQTVLAAKASEEASRLKQMGESGAAERQNSQQQKRERSARLEQDLAAARRDVETQSALATKASAEASRLKQAEERGAAELQKSLQQERERSARLEQDLVAARRDIETKIALATKASEEACRLKQAGESSALELQKSLRQEREQSARLEQELAAARRDIETKTALAAKASEEASRLKQAEESGAAELQKSLQQEREWSARLEQDLAAARRDVETQAAQATKASEEASGLNQAQARGAAEMQKSLQQERERSARLEQDLAARRRVETQTALATKADKEPSRLNQAGESAAAELQKSLQQERERSARLQQDLATARRDVETQTALAAKAGEDALRRKQSADASATQLRQLQKERERADALAQDLSMTRSAIYAYEAQARQAGDEAAELRQAVANGAPSLRKSALETGDRAERLEQDLMTARRDIETQTALAAKASEEAAKARQTAQRDLAAVSSSLQQERARAKRLERDLALAQRVATDVVTTGSNARDNPVDEKNPTAADQAPAASARGDAQPNSEEVAVAAGLVARASALLRQGDIGAARVVLERAVEMGSAQASFSLAETYDPLILAKWGTYGTRGDAIKAQNLYAKADAAGIKEAKVRVKALRR
jgi:hypothetical protein